jgi:hypothetical protein
MSQHFYQFLPHLSHKDKLEKINKMGIPAEKPRNSIISARRSKKALNADAHPVA